MIDLLALCADVALDGTSVRGLGGRALPTIGPVIPRRLGRRLPDPEACRTSVILEASVIGGVAPKRPCEALRDEDFGDVPAFGAAPGDNPAIGIAVKWFAVDFATRHQFSEALRRRFVASPSFLALSGAALAEFGRVDAVEPDHHRADAETIPVDNLRRTGNAPSRHCRWRGEKGREQHRNRLLRHSVPAQHAPGP